MQRSLSFFKKSLAIVLISPLLLFGSNTPNPAGVGQMVPKVKGIKDGFEITAQVHQANLGSKITMTLVAEVTDQNGDQHLVEIKRLEDGFVHSQSQYKTKRVFQLTYDELNKELAKLAPKSNLVVAPGQKMWVYARWMNDPKNKDPYVDGVNVRNHEWGGIARGGEITLPSPSNGQQRRAASPGSQSNSQSGFTRGGMTTDLDVANQVDPQTAQDFPGLSTSLSLGSRFEQELKLHVDLSDFSRVEKLLTTLVNDPAKVEKMFGRGWTMTEDRTYVGKPMVDVYLDNKSRDGAKNGTALRFRTGNGTTSLNYKPNDGKYEGDGVYTRIEYQAEGLKSAKSIDPFMDSDHPLNFLQLLREIAPNGSPSDFTGKAAKIVDKRRKFKIHGPGGDEVEISLDRFKANRMAGGKVTGPTVEIGQLEVELNHLGVGGSNNYSSGSGSRKYYSMEDTYHGREKNTFLKQLGAGSNLSGFIAPTFHGADDLKTGSPIRKAHAGDFKTAASVFGKLRKHLFGNNWLPSGQKYALAAAALGMVPIKEAAPSVQRMIQEQLGKKRIPEAEMTKCLLSLVKLSKK